MKAIIVYVLTLTFCSAAHAQIFTDDELLQKGNDYYTKNRYRLAQTYLFAYVQRNPTSYRKGGTFKTQVDAALDYAGNHADEGTTTVYDYHFPTGDHPGTHNQMKGQQMATVHAIDKQKMYTTADKSVDYNTLPQSPQKPVIGAAPTTANATLNNGVYTCDDGLTYNVLVIDDNVWFFTRSGDSTWSTVVHGKLAGDQIVGAWCGLPGSSATGGSLTLQVTSPGAIRLVNQTGGFTGNAWQQAKKKD